METNKRHEVSSDEVRELHRNVVFEKIDKCNKCEKVFANKKNLSSHIKWVHETTEGVHECLVCKMKFKNRLTCLGITRSMKV